MAAIIPARRVTEMFKRKSAQDATPVTLLAGSEVYEATPVRESISTVRTRELALIGASIRIQGDVDGEEDLIVRGHVEGSVTLRGHRLMVGEEGDLKATIDAGAVDIEGRVDGALTAEEQVVVRRSGRVAGNIRAPRVTLEDGCKFNGTIEMDIEPIAKPMGSAKVTPFSPRSEDDAREKAS
jgi:cytoskeletal protein CcmA (bactofilin family)